MFKKVVTGLLVGSLGLMVLFLMLPGCLEIMEEEPEKMVEFAAHEEFVMDEEDGLEAFQEKYDFEFDMVHEMEVGLTHEALRAEDVDAAQGFPTDGIIEKMDLYPLEDDQDFFPVNHYAPLVKEEVLERYPIVEEVMGKVARELDNESMRELNYLVDIKEKDPSQVARGWLEEKELLIEGPQEGMVPEEPPSDDPVKRGPVIVGSVEFVEQQILGKISAEVLKNINIPVEKVIPLGPSEVARGAIKEGDIHLYWENPATVWEEFYHQEEPLPGKEAYEKVAEKDMQDGLIWLEPASYEHTKAILIRQEYAEEYDINTISQFVRWAEQVRSGEIER